MNLHTVAQQMRTALDTVPGLVVPEWGTKASGLPAALVGWPEGYSFTETYGRGKAGTDDWPVIVIVPAGTDHRSAYKALAAFLSDAAPGSAVVALEAGPYTACDFVSVVSAEFDPDARYGAVPIIAAILHCKITGPGR